MRHTVEVDFFHILIDDRYAMMVRNERGQERKTGDRQVRLLAEQPHTFFHSPKGDIEPGVDNNDIAHTHLFQRDGLR